MPDADAMYAALLALSKEADDHHKNLRALLDGGGLTPDVLAGALVDTTSIQADLAARLAEILSQEEADIDEGEDDDDEMDEVEAGLEPEEAELLRKLINNHAMTVDAMLKDGAATPELQREKADCERALGIINDLELEPDAEGDAETEEPEAEAETETEEPPN